MGRLTLDQFTRYDTLNIFCDASVKTLRGEPTGCFGAVAVVGNTMATEQYHIANNTTNNNSEIKGIRDAVNIAAMYNGLYPIINIFSDSEQAVAGIRNRITKWKIIDNIMYTRHGTPVQSQSVYTEIVYTILNYNLNINIYEIKGHVSRNIESLNFARDYFKEKNGIYFDVDLSLIEYLEGWNAYIDNAVRSNLDNYDFSVRYKQPLQFIPTKFDTKKYNNLMKLQY